MSRPTTLIRAAAVALGTTVLVAVGAAAVADDNYGDNEVDVTVEIVAIEEPGVLALTVAGTTATLSENGSDELIRQFTGTLPTVTVTDTRAAEDVPAGAAWYVLGSSTGFIGDAGQPEIGAEYLGWAPRLVLGSDSGLVAEGDPVNSAADVDADDNVGLVDQELLASTADSSAVRTEGQWSVTADLSLRTPATVAAGNYTATVTLSLFE